MVSYISGNGYNRLTLGGKIVSKQLKEDTNIFKFGADLERDFNRRNIFYAEDYKTPREKFEEIQSKQGIIGQTINNFKNSFQSFALIGMIGSNEVERVLNNYENGSAREFDALDTVEKYGKNQKFLKEFLLNLLTLFIIVLMFVIFVIFDVDIGKSLTACCLMSGTVRILCEKLEVMTCNIIKEKSSPPQNNFFMTKDFAMSLTS